MQSGVDGTHEGDVVGVSLVRRPFKIKNNIIEQDAGESYCNEM